MSEAICEPLDNLKEVYEFMADPPKWGRLTSTRSRRSRAVPNSSLYVEGHACHVPPHDGSLSSEASAGPDEDLPKTLVCHDMKNGYHDDRYVDGSEDHSAYLFYHWSAIDIFVYFSHHFVTIPPLCWINIAHKHGVQILGTIITEWDDGFKICKEFLETEDEYRKFALHLVSIAEYFKLDGWLLNVENKVENVPNLIGFIEHLTNMMHQVIPGSTVIWYDSVINDGSLKWQNRLNDKNRAFFDVCDGIFTNYSWSPSHLKNSLIEAGSRKHDVFVGVDVWGRNFWGGGCFNTSMALKEIHNNGLSVAIFAPAWTHEGIRTDEMNQLNHIIKPKLCDDSNEYSIFSKAYDTAFPTEKLCMTRYYFLMRENAFWNTLWPYLNTKGPTQLPFHTFFCIGSGKMKRVNGRVIQDKPWFNLREQQYQLSFPVCAINARIEKVLKPLPENEKNKKPEYIFKVYPNIEQDGCLSHYTKDSYHGGNCIKISPLKDFGQCKIRLFLCEFKCDQNFVIYYIYKRLDGAEQNLDLLLSMKNNTTKHGFEVNLSSSEVSRSSDPFHFNSINLENKHFTNLKNNLKLYYPSYYISDLSDNWEIKYFLVKVPDSTITGINCKLINEIGKILLGGLGVVKNVPLT